jgi:hypothetical protein
VANGNSHWRRFFYFDISFFFFDKGVTWIALGCVAEVPPLVSAASLSFPPPFFKYFVCVVGIHSVAFEWYVSVYL